ncbi:unnamed protein product, partial [Dovyalis caffra]
MERRNLHPKNIDMFCQASHELQLDGAVYAMLDKEIAEKTRELRHMRGEDLQGLNIEELQKLEKLIQGSLCRVLEEKEDKIVNEMDALKRKMEELIEENQRLEQQLMNLSAGKGQLLERGQSSDSLVTNISSMSSADLRQDSDSSCAFLTLGLACYSHFHANGFYEFHSLDVVPLVNEPPLMKNLLNLLLLGFDLLLLRLRRRLVNKDDEPKKEEEGDLDG